MGSSAFIRSFMPELPILLLPTIDNELYSNKAESD